MTSFMKVKVDISVMLCFFFPLKDKCDLCCIPAVLPCEGGAGCPHLTVVLREVLEVMIGANDLRCEEFRGNVCSVCRSCVRSPCVFYTFLAPILEIRVSYQKKEKKTNIYVRKNFQFCHFCPCLFSDRSAIYVKFTFFAFNMYFSFTLFF